MRLLHSATASGATGAALDDAGLLALYRHPAPTGRAWLRTNFISTLDGSIQGPDGRSGTINTESDHRVFALHRALADVILVGAQTVRTEGYRAVDLTGPQRDLRAAEGLRPFPTLAVVTGAAALDPAVATAAEQPYGPVLIITGDAAAEASLSRLVDAGAEVVRLPGARVDPREVVGLLLDRGLPRILCEGGPHLHRDLLAAGLVDELSLTLSPTAVGGAGQRSTSGPALPDPPQFRLQHVLAADDQTVFLTYRRG